MYVWLLSVLSNVYHHVPIFGLQIFTLGYIRISRPCSKRSNSNIPARFISEEPCELSENDPLDLVAVLVQDEAIHPKAVLFPPCLNGILHFVPCCRHDTPVCPVVATNGTDECFVVVELDTCFHPFVLGTRLRDMQQKTGLVIETLQWQTEGHLGALEGRQGAR